MLYFKLKLFVYVHYFLSCSLVELGIVLFLFCDLLSLYLHVIDIQEYFLKCAYINYFTLQRYFEKYLKSLQNKFFIY